MLCPLKARRGGGGQGLSGRFRKNASFFLDVLPMEVTQKVELYLQSSNFL